MEYFLKIVKIFDFLKYPTLKILASEIPFLKKI